jgi:hypothetical protein
MQTLTSFLTSKVRGVPHYPARPFQMSSKFLLLFTFRQTRFTRFHNRLRSVSDLQLAKDI